jgi:hypothetical protein
VCNKLLINDNDNALALRNHFDCIATLTPSQVKTCGGFFDTQKEVVQCLGNLKGLVRILVARNLWKEGSASFMQSRSIDAITSMSVIPRAANVTAVNGEKLETGIFPSILFANSA